MILGFYRLPHQNNSHCLAAALQQRCIFEGHPFLQLASCVKFWGKLSGKLMLNLLVFLFIHLLVLVDTVAAKTIAIRVKLDIPDIIPLDA